MAGRWRCADLDGCTISPDHRCGRWRYRAVIVVRSAETPAIALALIGGYRPPRWHSHMPTRSLLGLAPWAWPWPWSAACHRPKPSGVVAGAELRYQLPRRERLLRHGRAAVFQPRLAEWLGQRPTRPKRCCHLAVPPITGPPILAPTTSVWSGPMAARRNCGASTSASPAPSPPPTAGCARTDAWPSPDGAAMAPIPPPAAPRPAAQPAVPQSGRPSSHRYGRAWHKAAAAPFPAAPSGS